MPNRSARRPIRRMRPHERALAPIALLMTAIVLCLPAIHACAHGHAAESCSVVQHGWTTGKSVSADHAEDCPVCAMRLGESLHVAAASGLHSIHAAFGAVTYSPPVV